MSPCDVSYWKTEESRRRDEIVYLIDEIARLRGAIVAFRDARWELARSIMEDWTCSAEEQYVIALHRTEYALEKIAQEQVAREEP